MPPHQSARPAAASDYIPTGSDASSAIRGPDSWVAGLVTGAYERVDIHGGQSVQPKHMRLQASIPVDPNAGAAALYQQIDRCAVSSGFPFVRVTAYRPGEKQASDLLLWPVPPPPPPAEDDEAQSPTNVPAAYAGLLRQAYAHNEHLLGMVQAQTTALLMHLQEENKVLREERIAMRAALEVANTHANDREAKLFQMQIQGNRERAIIGGAETLVSAAATHIAKPDGAKAIGAPHPVTEAVQELASGLAPEQLIKLAEVFSAEQMALLNAILEKSGGKA